MRRDAALTGVKAMGSRVLVVECHPVTRWGFSRLIDEQDDLIAVAETGSPEEAVKLAAVLIPDVVTIGLGRAQGYGLSLARELRDRFDDLGIVVLSASDQDDILLTAFETGVSAFVSKSAPVVEVLAAVRHAAVSASSFTASGLAAALRRRRDAIPTDDLSPREREVLRLLTAGHSVPSVADFLQISPSTAKTYVSRLYEKLGARNRAEAVMSAVRLGLVDRSCAGSTPVEWGTSLPVAARLVPGQRSAPGTSRMASGRGAV